MPWPPTSEYLLSSGDQLPSALLKFLTALLSKQGTGHISGRSERLVRSMAQDICYNVTCGQWKMPKHLLLGMTMRHLTGSFQVINILNRFGHCASHSTLLELETAMCDSVVECSTNLPSAALAYPKITHFCWDNFDLTEETIDGSGTTYSTHGIMIQEIKEENMEKIMEQPTVKTGKTKKRSATLIHFHPYLNQLVYTL